MEMAYQHTIYDEYLSLLEQDYLNEEQIKFLLQFECPLSVCYDAVVKNRCFVYGNTTRSSQ